MTLLSKVGNYLIENTESLALKVVEEVLHRMELKIPEWEKEQAVAMYKKLMGFLGISLIEDRDGIPEELISWSKGNGERQAQTGEKISTIIVRYPTTRDVFSDLLTEISEEFELPKKETIFVIKKVNNILDISLNESVFAYERSTDQMMDQTKREMAELSAPVVPVKDHVAILPLIGEIDPYRAAYIMDKVVPKIAKLQINYLIADFSGILTLDDEVAHYLYQLENVFRLLGIQLIVTGMRPELAQAVVRSGIDMSSIPTFAYVKQALESLT
ncbi:STAS domain-containing protein [Bacillus thermotolerans]|uniref:Sulfate transporter/antisigma-factor antagonist STAS n=1 Tax=Bacillus thermotolerans TaxID=1221996 RepID=A0A0F5I6A3_BACTR|nr:STAS domain-containing protein [Bacillus thermotolerans]KKB38031.1 Sulfate transporter/antisigma-factor antagonist STAS [Bacillus thermotolerans]KKB40692.1 Sulfate transporter/antisigma-factor antagonist STAS [Bacillus thermotolerans]KKB43773.1 Sulfate transporter/antisigma-factor antagonist STAS [Bacillus thermotolerans]